MSPTEASTMGRVFTRTRVRRGGARWSRAARSGAAPCFGRTSRAKRPPWLARAAARRAQRPVIEPHLYPHPLARHRTRALDRMATPFATQPRGAQLERRRRPARPRGAAASRASAAGVSTCGCTLRLRCALARARPLRRRLPFTLPSGSAAPRRARRRARSPRPCPGPAIRALRGARPGVGLTGLPCGPAPAGPLAEEESADRSQPEGLKDSGPAAAAGSTSRPPRARRGCS